MLKNLSPREKLSIGAGSVLVLAFMVCQFVYFPAIDRREDLKNRLTAEKASLDKIRELRNLYNANSTQDLHADYLKSRPRDFTLFSYIDRRASQARVKEKVEYMKPFTQKTDNSPHTLARVKLKLNNLYLDELINFIRLIESKGNGVRITSFTLTRTGKQRDRLNAVLETQTLEAAQ